MNTDETKTRMSCISDWSSLKKEKNSPVARPHIFKKPCLVY